MSTQIFGLGRSDALWGAQNDPLLTQALKTQASGKGDSEDPLRKTFNAFLGEVYFGQMLKAMRKTVGKPAYVYGGQAEEIFTQQLDQVLAESLAQTIAPQLSGPMFELFALFRR